MPKKPTKKEADGLAQQLAFVASILKPKGTPEETCCVISDKAITARNGPLSVGILTEADLTGSPHCLQLIAALSKCKTGYSMTSSYGTITVKSGPFTAKLPTVVGLLPSAPDGYVQPLGPELFAAIAQIAAISDEDADHVQSANICVSEGMVSTTNRHIILQAWHGINLPTMMIPKRFVSAVIKSGKPIVGIGHSDNSFTVFFDDNSWLRTIVSEGTVPPYESYCNWTGSWLPFPDIWEAVDTIMPFRGNSDAVRLEDGAVKTDTASHDADWTGAVRLNADYLKAVKPHLVNFAIDSGKMYFYNGNVRGVIALMN